MSRSSQGRVVGAAMIPEALRAVLTTTQQFLLMDTVLVVSVNDLRRALCDAEFAERLVQRPEPAPPVQQRAFTPRAATEAELAAVAQLEVAAAAEAARQASINERNRITRERFQQEAEEQRRQREAASAAAIERGNRAAEAARREAEDLRAELRRESEAAERLRVVNLREQIQQRSNQQRQPAARQQRQPPGRRNAPGRGPQGFDAAIRNITQAEGHRPGHVPVLGGQASAREESLAQARANRVPVDWNSETLWRSYRAPRSAPLSRISDMGEQQLVNEIAEVILNVTVVFQLYADESTVWSPRDDRSALVQAKRWLAVQPSFRALVQEAVRRGVQLSAASTSYITQFVLGASSNAQLADFVNHPVRVVTEESVVDTFGRGGRALRLDDD